MKEISSAKFSARCVAAAIARRFASALDTHTLHLHSGNVFSRKGLFGVADHHGRLPHRAVTDNYTFYVVEIHSRLANSQRQLKNK